MEAEKRAQRELKSPQTSETRRVRVGAAGEYAKFVQDNTQKGTIDVVRLSRVNCKFKSLLGLQRRRLTGQNSDLGITRKTLVQGYRKLKCRGAAWGSLRLASRQSAISELQAPAWSCLAEPSPWPDTERERVSFCCRVRHCDGVSVLLGQRPLSKTFHTHRGWTGSFQSGHA